MEKYFAPNSILKTFTKGTIQILFSCLFLFSFIQMANSQWLGPHTAIDLGNQPSKGSLISVMATNIDKSSANPAGASLLGTARNFHQMETDYAYSYFPSDGVPNINTNPGSSAFTNCASCFDILTPGTGNAFCSNKSWYWNWQTAGFGEMYASLESIFPKLDFIGNDDNPCSDIDIVRGYPNKWYSLEEWGGIDNIQQNARNYAHNFAASFCPIDGDCLVDVLEMSNEAWGDGFPGKAGFHLLLEGMIQGLNDYYGNPDNWKMKIAPGAFEAFTATPGCGLGDNLQYVEEMVPDHLREYFNYISVHNYAFSGASGGSIDCSAVTETPESNDGMFLTLKNMKKWQMTEMSHAEVNITEFGWNVYEGSAAVGEAGQNAYIMRSFLLANRYDIHKVFVYSHNDPEGECPLYCSTGLYNAGGNGRKIVDAINKVKSKPVGGEKFLKALQEVAGPNNGKFAYLYGAGGKPSHLVVWKPDTHSNLNSYPPVDNAYTQIDLPTGLSIDLSKKYYYLSWDETMDNFPTNNGFGVVDIQGLPSHSVNVKLSGMPLAIPLGSSECFIDENGNLNNCGQCIDEDYDGYCQYEDCNDLDPGVPMQVGSSCDDGNPLTQDDQILGDGCTCEGIIPDYCGEDYINVLVIGNQVIVSLINPLSDNQIVKLYNSSGVELDQCNSFGNSNCAPVVIFPKPTIPGTYNINIQLFFGEESPLNCNSVIEFEVLGECIDNDGDGTCVEYDCDDNNPLLPMMPGTNCDDGNPNTSMDIIQNDGCTCAGFSSCDPPLAIGSDCDDGNPLTGNDQIVDDNCTCEGTCDILPGTPCNDGNPNTGPDIIQTDCTCFGECNVVGEPCDDGDPSTENDTFDDQCNCIGDPIDDDPCIEVELTLGPENTLWVNNIATDEVQIKLYDSNGDQVGVCDFYPTNGATPCNLPNHSFGWHPPGDYKAFVDFYGICSVWLDITFSKSMKPVIKLSKTPPPGVKIETRDKDGKVISDVAIIEFMVNLSPNPARDILFLNASNSIKDIEVWSALGEPILKHKLDDLTTNYQIDLKDYTPGVYFCKTISIENNIVIKAFVVQ